MSKSTVKYLGKRVLISLLTLLVIVAILFLMLKLMPGTPFNDEKLSEAQKAQLYAKYGLDQPLIIQFFTYIKNMMMGDFGTSFGISRNQPVANLILPRIPISFGIGIAAVILGTIVGIALGIYAAKHKNTAGDTIATLFSVLGVSVPSFVVALLLLLIFGVQIPVFPVLFDSDNIIVSSILPVIALSFGVIANVGRFTRSEMIAVLSSDYIALAEAKGLDSKLIIKKHAIRNALIPVITILGPILVNLMTGSMVLEQIFSIPGLGSLLVKGITVNDHNVVLAVAFLYSILYVVLMLIIDILYGIIDPRIRIAKGE
ncbi:ABC transporter permease [Candidatus Epulonipiscium viviparus]|uniref:ABC transporter permease n=1 Tax=Candidatus Epulonipiscium viviparus TaxID=420336 RepID=UPI00016C05AE|nr:ABC transporter permease [Candidatus Epulopiscium viviparus]